MQLKGLGQSLTIEIVEHKQNKHCKTSLINVIKDFKHQRRATKHSIILLQEKLLASINSPEGLGKFMLVKQSCEILYLYKGHSVCLKIEPSAKGVLIPCS